MLVDANLLLYATDSGSRFHPPARDWLLERLNGSRRLALPWQSLGAFLRLATHPRVSARPLAPADAWGAVSAWLRSPAADRPILVRVATRVEDPLARAALSERERRVVARLVSMLREELGEDLLAVWLYGSRARGEADPAETHPDRRSDVDLMVVVDPRRDASSVSWEIDPLLEAATEAEGDSPVWYPVLVWDTEWLRDRRRIRSFFVQEVDRDKIVLAGNALEGAEAP